MSEKQAVVWLLRQMASAMEADSIGCPSTNSDLYPWFLAHADSAYARGEFALALHAAHGVAASASDPVELVAAVVLVSSLQERLRVARSIESADDLIARAREGSKT